MAGFTTCTINHTFSNADGSPASGTIEATISQAMTNGGTTIVPAAHVSTTLSSAGVYSQTLTSTLDAATFPQGCLWRFDFRIAGASIESFFAPIPSGGVTVDLSTLMPFTIPPEVA